MTAAASGVVYSSARGLASDVCIALEREASKNVFGRRSSGAPELQPMLAPVLPALAAAGYRSVIAAKSVQRIICDGARHVGADPHDWTTAEWVEVRQLFASAHNRLPLTVCAFRGYAVQAAPGDGLLVSDAPQMLARRLFGRAAIEDAAERLRDAVRQIGYRGGPEHAQLFRLCVNELMLQQGTGDLGAVTETAAAAVLALPRGAGRRSSRELPMLTAGLTQLGILREPTKWLGHATLEAGRHYIKLTPVRLMAAFHRGARLTQAVRTVAALVDTRPGAGEPVVRYVLGHGWCTNDAFASCAHRMACARCSFYEPAIAFAPVLQRQRGRFVQMLQELDLTEDERAAAEGDAAAVEKLLGRLAVAPTPDESGGNPG